MADKLRTVKDYLSAKQQALQVLSGDAVDVFTEGYLFGGTLYNKNNIPYVAPVIANVRGVKSTSLSPRRLEDCEWVVPKVNTAGYYLYIGTGGNIFVDIQPPTEVTGYVGLYHPGRNARYIRDFYVNSAGRISNLDVSGSILTGYYGTGTYESPDEGDVALLIQDARIVTLQYLGGKWSVDVNKIAIGLLVGTMLLPMISCRGLIHPDADTSDLGDEIPTGNFLVIDCETAGFPDQNGDTPDVSTNTQQSGIWKKFGSYSLTATSGNRSYLRHDDVIELGVNVGYCSWVKLDGTITSANSSTATIDYLAYDIDVYNYLHIVCFYSAADEQLKIIFEERVSGSYLQDCRASIDLPLTTIKGSEGVFVGYLYNADTGRLYLVCYDEIAYVDTDPLTLTSGVPTLNARAIYCYNGYSVSGETLTLYQDDILFAYDDACNPDLFVNHYFSGQAWNTTYSYADLIFKPASGGKIRLAGETEYYAPVSGEPSVGTLHLIPVSDRPTSWVLSGGSASSFTTLTGFSAYVPSGVKALLLHGTVSWTGNGSIDYAYARLRKTGDTATSNFQYKTVIMQHTNLATGIVNSTQHEITIDCDTSGQIDYLVGNSAGSAGTTLYLTIIGYYI